MIEQIPAITLSGLARITSVFVGGLLVFWEAQTMSVDAPTGKESQENWEKQGPYSSMRLPWAIDRYPAINLLLGIFPPFRLIYFIMQPEFWICIGLMLIAIAIFSKNGYTVATPFLLTFALFRVFIFRLIEFAPNKHKFLVGNEVFKLIGETGILTKEVTPTEPELVQMQNPIFKKDIMDCFSDEGIKSGEEVKVLEVDCGLLKVARAEK